MPVEAIENCRELFCNKSLHGLAKRHSNLFGEVSFHFHDVRRCNVVTYEIYVNTSITVKILGGISFRVMTEAGNVWWIHLLFRRFLCVRIEIESRLQ